ncbi:LmbU family transcriptional regulator [Kitasatospora sp. NPDC093102]|uniref:LmbU family transcriptional regulator n=1 Tax=Kitasatospora sp. NPDC093102 TaxID=3155069 RepID=UPI00342D83FC
MAGSPSVRARTGDSSKPAKSAANTRTVFDTSDFVTRRGLLLPQRISFDKWVGIGSYLSNVVSASTWCLGDWLVYGEASFNGRYRDAIELTSLDYQTLRNHAWVARRFPMSRRRDSLSFTHHAEVASLSEPEQDFWLRTAEENGWSAKRLRREVKASFSDRGEDRNGREQESGRKAATPVASTAGDTVSLRVPVPADRLEFCRATASRFGLNVEAWASQILLEAARKAPSEPMLQGLPAGVPARAVRKSA